jgi:hypothetical protein
MKLALLALVLVPVLAFAGIDDPIATEDFLKALWDFIVSPKGSTLAIVAAIVQLAMMFVNTTMGSITGKYKLAILYSLSAVATVVGGMLAGMGFIEALLSGAALAAIMNAVHQWMKPASVVTADVKGK